MGNVEQASNAKPSRKIVNHENKQRAPVKSRLAPSNQRSLKRTNVFANKNDHGTADQTKPVPRNAPQRADLEDKLSKRSVNANSTSKERKKTFDISTFPRVFSTSDLMEKMNSSTSD